jgi:hypothetical protein
VEKLLVLQAKNNLKLQPKSRLVHKNVENGHPKFNVETGHPNRRSAVEDQTTFLVDTG